jgi:hypothetical protein
MAFDWLNEFHHEMEKESDYAAKALAAYRLGMRGKGSIVGIRVEPAEGCCQAASNLPEGKIYGADEVPKLPLPGCPQGRQCACVYRPVMTYQKTVE